VNPQTTRNVRGNSKDPARGTACTPLWLARAVGPWDLDPFSNPRSHIASAQRCMLEDGGDGFGDGTRGSFRCGADGELQHATETTRVWGQPDYLFTLRAFRHYAHTRWCFLLRFDPRPEWFDLVHDAAEAVAIPRGTYDLACERRLSSTFNFELADGLRASGNTFPHALYYRRFDDITPAVKRTCIVYRKKPRI
jgi:hypothetical protein